MPSAWNIFSPITNLFGSSGPSNAQKNQSAAWQGLQSLFSTATSFGDTSQKKGSANMDAGSDYWNSLLKGDKTKMAAAVAPEASAARSSADAQKKQMANMGTARTGGANAQAQTIDDNVRAQINQMLFSIRPEAAKEVESIGAQQISQMLQALGIGESAIGTLGGQASSQVQADNANKAAMWSALIGGAADIATAGVSGMMRPK